MRIVAGLGAVVLACGQALVAASAGQGPDPAAATVPAPVPTLVAPGVWLLVGGVPADREPDGNTVVIEAPEGLVVVDTGRHAWHRQAILELARRRGRPIAAIINSHWHLDHVSGNPALRAQYPGLRVYASDAIDGALAGFLAKSARDAQAYVDDPQIPESLRADIRADRETIGNGAALRPDVVVDRSGRRRIAGRSIDVHLARDAATDGDVWILDRASGVVALGDLVTLPAPFLDTACPSGWKAALAQVARTRFRLAIPGHGAPMDRAQFARYRRAFEAFIDCSGSDRPRAACAAGWASDVQPLLGTGQDELQRARSMAGYYVDALRTGGGRSPYCNEPREPVAPRS